MKLSNLLVVNAIVLLIYAVALLLIPTQALTFFGFTTDVTGIWTTRTLGAALVGYVLLSWLARNVTEAVAQRAIVITFFVAWAADFIVTLLAQLSDPGNALNWIAVVIDALFALAFAYFLFMRRMA